MGAISWAENPVGNLPGQYPVITRREPVSLGNLLSLLKRLQDLELVYFAA
ncbi:MAG: hypothetical protein M3R24_31960 [Chloroflexota bacterium]|nr:hypothetical protein [Chloroflexota bacterium]